MKDENRKTGSLQKMPELLDAVAVAPEHHKVIYENEQLRIIEFRLKPGETVPVHTHRWPSISYVLSLSDFLSYDTHGNIKLDSRMGHSEIKQGEVFCLPPFPPPHSVENIGETEMHAISVELKN